MSVNGHKLPAVTDDYDGEGYCLVRSGLVSPAGQLAVMGEKNNIMTIPRAIIQFDWSSNLSTAMHVPLGHSLHSPQSGVTETINNEWVTKMHKNVSNPNRQWRIKSFMHFNPTLSHLQPLFHANNIHWRSMAWMVDKILSQIMNSLVGEGICLLIFGWRGSEIRRGIDINYLSIEWCNLVISITKTTQINPDWIF